ncbi:MAG: class II fructose-bisphosphate aldolase [bacterium]|nr:class II fructose-bisphosphate aldolase [bacterium]
MEYKTIPELCSALQDIVKIQSAQSVKILSEKKLREGLIDQLVWNSVFNPDEELRTATRALIRNIARATGAFPASIQSLYEAEGEGKISHITAPAINIRGMTYEFARSILRAQIKKKAFPVVFEIARSEMGYTEQRPAEFATCILAAAIKEGYKGALFIQGDHFQINVKKFATEPEKEVQAIRDLIDEGIAYGFYNIDIDSSTLVDLSKPTVREQQRLNFEVCATLTHHIRQREPHGVTVSVGGEIGEVGKKNTTVEEFENFMEGYLETLKKKGAMKGISKISIQTGTSHGGIPLADGSVASVKLDFNVLRDIGTVGRKKYGLSGSVQHGASTLPDELFDKFPEVETAEIHLATGFQNMTYDHPAFPQELKQEIYTHLRKACAAEKKEGQTDEQFIYTTRKKGYGPFKKKMWSLPKEVQGKIMKTLEEKFMFFFDKLNVSGRQEEAEKFMKIVDIPMPLPSTLRPSN